MFHKVTRQTAHYVNRLPSFPHYAEEGQDLPIKFQFYLSLPEKRYYLLHGPVKCRDFLGDVICSKHFQNRSSIYGFEVDFDKWSKDVIAGWEEWMSLGLKITFPSVEYKKNFCVNFDTILTRFGFGNLDFRGNDFLNGSVTELHLNVPHYINPIGLSWLTFLVKIAAHDIQNHADLVQILNEGPVTDFITVFTSIYSGKDAGYFSRVELDTFKWCSLICGLAMSPQSFVYLNEHANNISFLHNNSGFFSQFRREHTGMFANIVGTLINDLEQPVPFKYTPLTDEQRVKFLSGVDFSFRCGGIVGEVQNNRASVYQAPAKKVKISAKQHFTEQWLNATTAEEASAAQQASLAANPWSLASMSPVPPTAEEEVAPFWAEDNIADSESQV